jgi:hypothetical protein
MPVSAPGRVSVATNDCFGDPQSASGRSEHQAALEKLYFPVWVGRMSSPVTGPAIARETFAASRDRVQVRQ